MKNVLHKVVNVVKFLATCDLASKSSKEKIGSQTDGNVLRIIEFISQYDSFLAKHLVKYGNLGPGKTFYLSKTIYKELIDLMGKEAFSLQ